MTETARTPARATWEAGRHYWTYWYLPYSQYGTIHADMTRVDF